MRTNYKPYYDRAIPGMREGSINFPRVRASVLRRGAVKEVWTITIPGTPTADTTYTVTLNNGLGVARFKADATPTQEELRVGIMTAIQTNPMFGQRGIIEAPSGSTTTLTFTALNFGIENILTSSGLTVSKTTAGAMPKPVPFGRFVARPAGETDPDVAGLPTDVTDKIMGITHIVHDIEETPSRFTTSAYTGTTYPYQDVMDVVDRTGESTGIWVECVDADITINDPVYVSVAAGHEGKVTKSTSGTIDISNRAAFQGSPVTTATGSLCVLVGFNVP